MKWLNIVPLLPNALANEDGTAGVGQYGYGDWFFVIGGETVEGFATRDDAIDAAEQHLAKLKTAVPA